MTAGLYLAAGLAIAQRKLGFSTGACRDILDGRGGAVAGCRFSCVFVHFVLFMFVPPGFIPRVR